MRRSGPALLHGVCAVLALSRTSAAEARKLRNPAVAPHLKFVDLGGRGYGLVTVTADWLETEFVRIQVPSSAAARLMVGRCAIACGTA